jgi:putative addiction module component (TIGR02574 family)
MSHQLCDGLRGVFDHVLRAAGQVREQRLFRVDAEVVVQRREQLAPRYRARRGWIPVLRPSRCGYTKNQSPEGRAVPTLEQLGIDRLTVAERLALVQQILDSVVADQPPPSLSDAKREELARRLADHLANPDDVVPWEQVKAEALARWQQ